MCLSTNVNVRRPDYLESLVTKLLEGDFQERWETVTQLVCYGETAIAALIPLLRSDDLDSEVRWFVAKALAAFDTQEALDALVHLLETTQEPELIAIAAEGISQFSARGIAALLRLYENPHHRLVAIQAIARMHHPDALPTLVAATKDSNSTVRATALAALSAVRSEQADQLLIKAVKDPAAKVRQEAVNLLGLRPYLLDTTDLVEILLPGLWDISPEVSTATASALGRLGTETAVAAMARVLTSPYTPEYLQLSLVRALGWVEKESALLALRSARAIPSALVQKEIIEVLGRVRSSQLQRRASEILQEWLQGLLPQASSHIAMIQSLVFALGNLSNAHNYSLLERLAQHPLLQIQLYAQAALRQMQVNLECLTGLSSDAVENEPQAAASYRLQSLT